jgi:hypothetical protein
MVSDCAGVCGAFVFWNRGVIYFCDHNFAVAFFPGIVYDTPILLTKGGERYEYYVICEQWKRVCKLRVYERLRIQKCAYKGELRPFAGYLRRF